jgi:hypothetical protein
LPATKQPKPAPASPAVAKVLPAGRKPTKGSKATDLARAVRRFLILRGEKVLFAGCVVACLVFCGIGLMHLPYSKSPDELKAATAKVLNDLESTKGVAALAKKLPKAPDVDKLKTWARKSTPAAAYAIGPLRAPYQEPKLRRGEPNVLPVERLLASSGYGPIAIQGAAPVPAPARTATTEEKPADPAKLEEERRKKLIEEKKKRARRTPAKAPPAKPAKEEKKPVEQPVAPQTPPKEKALLAQPPSGSHLEYRNWVCLMGAIPFVEQANEYRGAFGEAMFQSPERDQPHYALPQIERAEIVGKKRLRWRRVNVLAALEDQAQWAADYPEISDERLIDPELTGLLPPLVSVNYSPDQVTHPRVKVVVIETPKSADQPASTDSSATDTKSASTAKKPPPAIFNLRDKKRAAEKAPADDPAAEKASEGDQKAIDKPSGPPPIEIVDYRLFRFFDFDVQPGKVYCYRVKLVALNPNYELPVRFLADPAEAEGLFREGTWSAPTAPVAIAEGTRLLAGDVALAEAPDGEEQDQAADPIAQILVHFYDFATSQVANVLFNAARGSLLDQASVPVQVAGEDAGQPKPSRTGGKAKETTTPPAVDVFTGAVVVDYFGGDGIPGVRGRRVPGHVLVLDRYGKYQTLAQPDDAMAFEADAPSVELPPATVEQARK